MGKVKWDLYLENLLAASKKSHPVCRVTGMYQVCREPSRELSRELSREPRKEPSREYYLKYLNKV